MGECNGRAVESGASGERVGHGRPVFQLRPGLPVDVLQEAICHRLEMLSAVVQLVSRVELAPADAWELQRYGWAMNEPVDSLKELFYSAWEKSQSDRQE